MARVRKAKKAGAARAGLSVSHRERLVSELRADPKLAVAYILTCGISPASKCRCAGRSRAQKLPEPAAAPVLTQPVTTARLLQLLQPGELLKATSVG